MLINTHFLFQNISNNFIRTIGAEAFCDMLENNTTLKTLSVKGMYLKICFIDLDHN